MTVSPADVVIVVIYNQNVNGTLSPALSPSASTPKILPTNAQAVWVFNTLNSDGTLSPSTVS
jgi:hypothetical protein